MLPFVENTQFPKEPAFPASVCTGGWCYVVWYSTANTTDLPALGLNGREGGGAGVHGKCWKGVQLGMGEKKGGGGH